MPTPCPHPSSRPHTRLTLIGALEGYYYFFVFVFCLNLCRRKWKVDFALNVRKINRLNNKCVFGPWITWCAVFLRTRIKRFVENFIPASETFVNSWLLITIIVSSYRSFSKLCGACFFHAVIKVCLLFTFITEWVTTIYHRFYITWGHFEPYSVIVFLAVMFALIHAVIKQLRAVNLFPSTLYFNRFWQDSHSQMVPGSFKPGEGWQLPTFWTTWENIVSISTAMQQN